MHIHFCIAAVMKRSLFLILLMFSIPSLANTLQPALTNQFNEDLSIDTSNETDGVNHKLSPQGGAGPHGQIDPAYVFIDKQ